MSQNLEAQSHGFYARSTHFHAALIYDNAIFSSTWPFREGERIERLIPSLAAGGG
jgi:hypothetical protein